MLTFPVFGFIASGFEKACEMNSLIERASLKQAWSAGVRGGRSGGSCLFEYSLESYAGVADIQPILYNDG